MGERKTLILGGKSVRRLITMREAIRAVEVAFREQGMGRVRMPAKIYLTLPEYSGDFRAMPVYAEKIKKCSLKWVNVHPGNTRRGLPTVMAVILLSDPRTGFPLCFMDGTQVTGMRTGAAGAVAAKYLALRGAQTVSLVGCGVQAKTQIEALRELFVLREIKVWCPEQTLVRKFIRENAGLKIRMTGSEDVRGCVAEGDIVVTTTPSRRPLVKLAWLKKGAHINAIGADAKGKEELDPLILKKSKVVVDHWEQAAHSGEINVPVSRGIFKRKDVHAELGEIVSGKKRGRTSPEEITVFDSTGLAVQDLAVADKVYRNALKAGQGVRLTIL